MTDLEIDKKVIKWLDKLEKGDKNSLELILFYLEKLSSFDSDPRTLGRKVENFSDNRWRWRVGNYRIIGLVEESENIFTIRVIKIARKGDKTYK